jgi:transcriptional regulator with XRE-family HTH domain
MPREPSEAETLQIIRERTRQARMAMGWDVETMAKALGVTTEAYKKYETRKSSVIPTKKIRKFCILTGIDANWLMGYDVTRVRKIIDRAG